MVVMETLGCLILMNRMSPNITTECMTIMRGLLEDTPFETLHSGQGFRSDHNVAMEASENVRIEVDSLQPRSDYLSVGEGDNVLPANEPTHVQQDPLPARVHSESMDASLISNHHIEDQTPNVPECLQLDSWIEQQAVEAIYNPTMTYEVVHPGEGSSAGRKSELYMKLENWKRGVITAKGTPARNLPVFIDRQMVDNIATQGRQGVIWLPRNAEIKALDREIFQGTFGVVRRV
jgi:hypothetical protein